MTNIKNALYIRRVFTLFTALIYVVGLLLILPGGSGTANATQEDCEAPPSNGEWLDTGELGFACICASDDTRTSPDNQTCISKTEKEDCELPPSNGTWDETRANQPTCLCANSSTKGDGTGKTCVTKTIEDYCEFPPSNGTWLAAQSEGNTRGIAHCSCPATKQQSSDGNKCIEKPITDNGEEFVGGTIENPARVTPEQELCASGSVTGDKTTTECETTDTCADLNNCALLNRINQFLNLLAILVIPVIILMVVIGGIQYSAANGNPQGVTAAKQRIYNAAIALIAFMFMWSFLQWLLPGGTF